ncbi:MAG: hypothetical protein HQK76_03420 [Desulfobacterales bacterium]|nr:hypothetical protein [Desulfobacterales bacterium]
MIDNYKGINILGPYFFEKDRNGKDLCRTGIILPKYNFIVTGVEPHFELIQKLKDFLLLNKKFDINLYDIFQEVVCLQIKDSKIVIRPVPNDMERIFRADKILQRLFDKTFIEFSGIYDEKVRNEFRHRSQSWRVSPCPNNNEDICQCIKNSQCHVNTNSIYYYGFHTGERFLSYYEFIKIRSLIRENKKEAIIRLKEIVELTGKLNDRYYKELNFFLSKDQELPINLLEKLISVLEKDDINIDGSELLFDSFASIFREACGRELLEDDFEYPHWKTIMLCRLYNINERTLEEQSLGLSQEFSLNVRWLPGCYFEDNNPVFELNVEPRIRDLISYYLSTWENIVAINIGRIRLSLKIGIDKAIADKFGESRDVYVVNFELKSGETFVRIIRMIKWDVIHRLIQGKNKEQSINETNEYREYIWDRLNSSKCLGIAIPDFLEISIKENNIVFGEIPVFFFERPYYPGIVTDKIPKSYYETPGFIIKLSILLGIATASTLVLGRKCHKTGNLFFDNGDELVQFDSNNLPSNIVLIETTGSFYDWKSEFSEMLPYCLERFKKHLDKAIEKKCSQNDIKDAIDEYKLALMSELQRMKKLVSDDALKLYGFFDNKSSEDGGIRSRWEGILNRLSRTDINVLSELIDKTFYYYIK